MHSALQFIQLLRLASFESMLSYRAFLWGINNDPSLDWESPSASDAVIMSRDPRRPEDGKGSRIPGYRLSLPSRALRSLDRTEMERSARVSRSRRRDCFTSYLSRSALETPNTRSPHSIARDKPRDRLAEEKELLAAASPPRLRLTALASMFIPDPPRVLRPTVDQLEASCCRRCSKDHHDHVALRQLIPLSKQSR